MQTWYSTWTLAASCRHDEEKRRYRVTRAKTKTDGGGVAVMKNEETATTT
jgi:hypothetical protein